MNDVHSPIMAVEVSNDGNYAKLSRQMRFFAEHNIISPQIFPTIMETLREKGVGLANDNPTWVQRVSASRDSNIER